MIAAVLRVAGWIAVAQAALLALVMLGRRRLDCADRLLAGLLAILATAAATILASHAPIAAPVLAWLDLADLVLALAAGPTLAAWIAIRDSPAAALPRWFSAALAPAALALVAGLLGAATARDDPWATPRWALAAAVGLQCLFTVVAVVLHRRRGPAVRSPLAETALAGMILVHLAQLARFAGGAALEDIVPATMTLLLFALSFVALRESPALAARRGAAAPLPAPEAARILAGLERLLAEDLAHLDPGLSLARAARRLGVPAAALSRAVNQAGGQRFTDLVNQRRVEHARVLLLDPAWRHLSVEAIGQRSGFKARSTFFEAFRRHAQATPAEYRERGG